MIKITRLEDLNEVPEKEIIPYLKVLLENILKEYKHYCPNDSLGDIGTIIYLENEFDIKNHIELELSEPLKEDRFEWIEPIENGFYCNGLIIINNDKAINIIGKSNLFDLITEETNK